MMKTATYIILRDILGKTNDGDCLSPEDLGLVEYCANNPLTEKSKAARDLEKTCKALEKQGMTPTTSSVLEGVESFRTAKSQNNPKMHRVDTKR